MRLNPLNNILYIVAVTAEMFTKTGLIIAIEYAVQISDNNAKIIPEIVVFVLSSLFFSIGKIKHASPINIRKIAIHSDMVGISFSIKNPNKPENISGPANKIIAIKNGDNLFNDAKNKLSPSVMPIIPLMAIGTKNSCGIKN